MLELWSQYWAATRKRVRGAAAADLEDAVGAGRRRQRPTRSLLLVETREEFGEVLRTLAIGMLIEHRGLTHRPRGTRHAQHRGTSVAEERTDNTLGSLRQLADVTRISKSTLSDWFKGTRLPGPTALRNFAIVVGATETEAAELIQVRDRLAKVRGSGRASEHSPLVHTARAIELSVDTTEIEALRNLTGSLLETTQKRQQRRVDRPPATTSDFDEVLRDRYLLWVAATAPLTGAKHRAPITGELLEREKHAAARLNELLNDRDSDAHRAFNLAKARTEIGQKSASYFWELIDRAYGEAPPRPPRQDRDGDWAGWELFHYSNPLRRMGEFGGGADAEHSSPVETDDSEDPQ